MTRDKAIEEVKNYENYPNGLSKECRDYIIKALEQESTTKNDLGVDCVSRKEVEKLIYRFLLKATDENVAFYEHFLDLPSVTPQEPKTGHWISSNGVKYTYFNSFTICSECKKHPKELSNFCPNCGAKMVEPQGSEDA